MPPFWKKKPKLTLFRFGKRKQKDELPMQNMEEQDATNSIEIEERKRWRPGALSGTSWDSRHEEQQFQGNPPWPVHIYNPAGEEDALNTMSELLQGENSPPRNQAHVRSIDSLSTVSAAGIADHHQQPSIVGTVSEIDRIDQHVRRSLYTRSRGIPVALVDPGPAVIEEDERPVAEDEPPPLPTKYDNPEHISYVSITPRPGTQPPLGSPPLPTSSHQSVKNYFLSPQSQHDQLGLDLRSEQTASPGQRTIGMTPRRRESLSPSDRTASPPPQRTLSPIQNLPQVHEKTEDVSSDVGQVSRTNSTKSKRSTPASGVGSGRSLTYQRALNMGTPLRDPLPVQYDSTATLTRLASIRSVQPATAGVEMSDGRALVDAQRAFYGSHRSVSQRFFWGLPARHDQRVLDILNWVDEMAAPLASRGLLRFLATRSRGALFINVEYREDDRPRVDWIRFDEAQRMLDLVIQESMATYDPTMTTLVFAFLLSKTKNSVGIWRKKLSVPASTRMPLMLSINHVVGGLRDDKLVVLVEATPDSPPGTTKTPLAWPPPRLAPKGPLIFHSAPIEEVEEPMYTYPATETLGAPITHEFPSGRRQSALHVFGRSPSLASSTSVVVMDTPKKKRWWKRVFGGDQQGTIPRVSRVGGGKLRARPRKAKNPPPEHVHELDRKRSGLFTAEWD